MTMLITTHEERLLLKMQDRMKKQAIETLSTVQADANLLTNRQAHLNTLFSLGGPAKQFKPADDSPTPYVDVMVTVNQRALILMMLKGRRKSFALLDENRQLAELIDIEELVRMLTLTSLGTYASRLLIHALTTSEGKRPAPFKPFALHTKS